jgi:pilus assembly protein CpaB
MSVRTVLIVLLALVFGISAVAGVNQLRSRDPSEKPDDTNQIPVVVATMDVARGTTLTTDYLKVVNRNKDDVPAGAFSKVEEVNDRVASSPLVKNDLLLESRLAPKGTGRGLAALIPKGMQAVSIQIPSVAAGVAGLLLPGNKVDVLWTLPAQGSEGARTLPLIRNIEILAVDRILDTPTENKIERDMRSVTLLATPEQAQRLAMGQTQGTLHLTLRNPADGSVVQAPKPVSMEDIGVPPKPKEEPKEVVKVPPPAEEEGGKIRTLRGTQESEFGLRPATGKGR